MRRSLVAFACACRFARRLGDKRSMSVRGWGAGLLRDDAGEPGLSPGTVSRARSLRWDWRQGELVIRHGIGDTSHRGGIGRRPPSFAMWVYVEQPIPSATVFEFREGTKVTGFFRFPLEFTGWRQGRPSYGDFPSGKVTAKVDNIRIAAPGSVAKGTVFLDLIKYNTLSHGFAIIPEKEAQWRRPVPDERRFPKPDRATEAELAGIRKLLGSDDGPGIDETRA